MRTFNEVEAFELLAQARMELAEAREELVKAQRTMSALLDAVRELRVRLRRYEPPTEEVGDSFDDGDVEP